MRELRPGREGQPPEAIRALVFGAFMAIPVIYAFAGEGGGYDLIFRQGAALIIWSVLALGYLFGVLPLARPSRSVALPLLAFGLLIAWTGLSMTWTETREGTWAELARSLHYLGILVLAWSVIERRTWRAAAAGLSAGAIIVCSIAVLSRLAPAAFPEQAVVAPLDPSRLSYPLGYWNAIGAWAAMSAGIALAWGSQARNAAVRAASGAALPVAGLAVYLSYSRGAIIGLAIAVLVVLVLVADRGRTAVLALTSVVAGGASILAVRASPEIANGTGGARGGLVAGVLVAACVCCWWVARSLPSLRPLRFQVPPRVVRPIAAVCVAGLLVGVIALGPETASALRGSFLGPKPERGSDPAARLIGVGGQRSELWSSALDQFASAPLQGIGPGSFEFWFSRHTDDPAFVRDGHSIYLETLGELGLPGLLSLLAFVAALVAAALRARARLHGSARRGVAAGMLAAFAVLAFSLGVDEIWEMTAVTLLGLLCIAVLIASAATPVPRSGRALPAPARAMIVVAAIGFAVIQVPGIVSVDRQRASQRALAAGDPEAARELAEEAVSAEPWAASPHAQLALAEHWLGNSSQARLHLREAIDHESTNWRWQLLSARIHALEGRRMAARMAYQRARELRPTLPPDSETLIEYRRSG